MAWPCQPKRVRVCPWLCPSGSYSALMWVAGDDQHPNPPRSGAGYFATTHWSVVLAAGDSASPQAGEALEKLCRTYWYPLYAYARREGPSPEDAQRLTQGFFARFLKKDYLAQVKREKGRFR